MCKSILMLFFANFHWVSHPGAAPAAPPGIGLGSNGVICQLIYEKFIDGGFPKDGITW